jgi:hypothetical protein
LDVEVNCLLAEIDHVAREERLALLFEVLLISIEKAVQPWEELLGAVISVENLQDQKISKRSGKIHFPARLKI